MLASHGESYRQDRIEQAERLGISSSVVFDADYRDVASLTTLIQSSKVVASLRFEGSGDVGRARRRHRRRETGGGDRLPAHDGVAPSGAGIIVDHDDPDAMALALRRVLTRPELAASMAAEASRLAPSLGWSVIAGRYLELADAAGRNSHSYEIDAGDSLVLTSDTCST